MATPQRPDSTGRLRPATVEELLQDIFEAVQRGRGEPNVTGPDIADAIERLADRLDQTTSGRTEAVIAQDSLQELHGTLERLATVQRPDGTVTLDGPLELPERALQALERIADMPTEDDTRPVLEQIVDRLELLDFRLKGRQTVAGGGPSVVGLNTQGPVSPANQPTLEQVRDRLGVTPFSETLTADRNALISLSSVYPLSDLRNIVTGTVNFSGAEYEVTAEATLESAEIGRYQPGYAAEVGVGIRLPGTLPTSAKWGYYSTNNGIFWQITDGDLQAVLRRGGTDVTTVDRADFNIDQLNGNGPSGIEWGPDTNHIYQIRFSWYGYGQIEWQIVGQDANGRQQVWPVHRLNITGSTSIASPNLPITVEVADSGSVFVGGRQMSIIGKYRPNERISAAVQTGVTVSDSFVPLCSFRRKNETDAANVSLIFEGLSVVTGVDIELAAIVGATLTGASWGAPANRSASETAIETDSAATAFSGGESLWHEMIHADGQGSQRSGSSDATLDIRVPRLEPVTLVARRFTGGTDGTVRAVLRCAEAW